MPTLVQKDAQKFTYPQPPATNVIYAATNGSTTASGATPALAVTLTRALNLANSATQPQTVVLRGGVYDKQSNNELNKAGTILVAYDSEFPVISGFRPITGFTLVNGIYEAPYTYVPVAASTDSRAVTGANSVVKNGQFIMRGDVQLKQVGSKSALDPDTFFIDTAAGKIFTLESPTPFGGLAVVGAEFGMRVNAANCQIKGIGIMGYTKGFRINGTSGVVIDRVTARYFAVSAANAAPSSNSSMTRTELGNCGMVCYDGGGIFTAIEDCDIHDGNTSGFINSWSSGGVKITSNLISTVVNLSIKRNRIYDCVGSTALWIDINVKDQVISDNTIFNSGIGIEDEISQRNFYVNNLVYGCGVGLLASCTEAAEFWHNTILNCTSAVTIQDWGRDRSNSEAQNPKDGSWKTQATVVNNNLMVGGPNPGNYFIRTETFENETSQSYVSSIKNNYYVKSGAIPVNHIAWSPSATSQNVLYKTLASFQADYAGYEQGSVQVTSQAASLPNGAPMPAKVAAVFGQAANAVRAVGSNLTVGSGTPATPEPTLAQLQAQLAALEDSLLDVQNDRDRIRTDNLNLTSQVTNLTGQLATVTQERDEVAAELDRVLRDPASDLLEAALNKLASVKAILQADATTQALNIIG